MSRNNDGLTLGQLGEINAGLHAEVALLNEQVQELTEKLNRSEDYCIGVDAERMELHAKVQALAALSEERREFIVNGVELGYIRTPSVPLDKATGTYERCFLKPNFAADAILNEVRAQGADDFAAEMYRMANEHVANGRSKKCVVQCRAAAKSAEDYAAAIRKGEQP